MKTALLVLSFMFTSPISMAQERTPVWVCHASDSMGAAGIGRGPTRDEAADDALFNCQIRSKYGSCSLQSCSRL